eukprot:Pgem_evm1s17092
MSDSKKKYICQYPPCTKRYLNEHSRRQHHRTAHDHRRQKPAVRRAKRLAKEDLDKKKAETLAPAKPKPKPKLPLLTPPITDVAIASTSSASPYLSRPLTRIMSTSWCFLSSSTLSPAVEIWNKGYDVWLINNRGTIFGLNHTKLTIKDNKFWDFSFDEMRHDVHSNVKYILKLTKIKQIDLAGWSQ